MDDRFSLPFRSNEDVSIEELAYTLKDLDVFQCLSEEVLLEMASLVERITLPKDTLLFKQGDEGVFWYIVYSGSVDVRVSSSGDLAQAESVCSLSSGSTLGESVVFGGQRRTSVITQQATCFLAVSAENIKLFYDRNFEHVKGLFQNINIDTVDGLARADADVEQLDGRVTPLHSRRSSRFGSPVASFVNMKDTQVVLTGFQLYQLIKEHFPFLLKEYTFNLRTYPDCCSGKELVNWVVLNSSMERSRNMVIGMLQVLLDTGVIGHVHNLQQFRDDPDIFYHFTICGPSESPSPARLSIQSESSGRGSLELPSGRVKSAHSMNSILSSGSSLSTDSLTNQLDDIFDILEQCAPESLTYAAFMKKPLDRTEDDILIIFEEIMHVKAFSQMSHAIKRELAGCIAYESYHGKAGHILFKQGDVGSSWYIILKGSVNVVVNGKGVVCTLHEGDDFGKLALVNDAPRAASIQLRDEHCSFIRIDKDDFNRILHSVEANTVRFREYGRDVLVLEKGESGRYSVVSGTPEKMVEHLMDCAMKDDNNTDPFFYEFFLAHPIFISVERICSILLSAYKGQWNQVGSTQTQIVIVTEGGMEQVDNGEEVDGSLEETKKKVVLLLVRWMQVMGQDIVADPAFDSLFRQITSRLLKDNLLDSLDTLNKSLMNSYLSRRGMTNTLGKATNGTKQIYRRSVGGVSASLPVMPAALPTDEDTVTVYTTDRRHVQFDVHLSTPSEAVLVEACRRLNIPAPASMNLCELTSSGEYKVIKPNVLSPQSTIQLNSVLIILPKGFSDKLAPLPDQNVLPVAEEGTFLERESSRDIAAHLTAYDFELLQNVSRTEFVYHIFGRHKFGKITTNLDILLRRFNEVQYWVVTEVCRTESLQSRVRIVCKFIKIADHCKSANNLNSFFGIVFGLINSTVTRLKTTWEKVPNKLKKKLESFEALTNPSRNHRPLRMYQSNLKPPVIPFLPLVMKDAAFIHEGNDTFVSDSLVNFEKMRMLASRVRGVETFRAHSIADSITSATVRTPHIRDAIRNLKVMNNQKLRPAPPHQD